MRTHDTTFSDVIKGRASFAGLKLCDVEKKAGIPHSTMWRRMEDGEWTRTQVRQMHRFLHFTPEDLQIFLEGK